MSVDRASIASSARARLRSRVVLVDGADNNVDGTQVLSAVTLTAVGSGTDDRLTGTQERRHAQWRWRAATTSTAGRATTRSTAGRGRTSSSTVPATTPIVGGPDNDTWTAGAGTDSFMPGTGVDSVSYSGRSGNVTVTLAGGADDGEAGEGDDVGADAEHADGGNGQRRARRQQPRECAQRWRGQRLDQGRDGLKTGSSATRATT